MAMNQAGTVCRTAALLPAAMLIFALRLGAQQAQPTSASFRPFRVDWTGYGSVVPVSAHPEILRQFTRVVEVFKAVPGLEEPLGGAYIEPNVVMFGPPDFEPPRPGEPLPAMLLMRVYSYNQAMRSSRNCYQFHIVANALERLPSGASLLDFADEEKFYPEDRIPLHTTSVPGVYTLRRATLLTKRTAPAFVPVTRERFLQRRLRMEQQNVAELKATKARNDKYRLPSEPTSQAMEAAQQRAARVQTMLATLSPAERSAQAERGCGETDPVTWLCKPGVAGREKLVMVNPEFYDRSLPRTAFQVLVLWGEETYANPSSRQIADNAWKRLDWKAMLDVLR